MAEIERTEVRLPSGVKRLKDVSASFDFRANVPARLQVWLHDQDKEGRIEVVDVRMFLRSLELKRDAIPVDFDHMRTYLPGSKEVDARLIDVPGWAWKFQTIKGQRVAVPVKVRR